MDGSGQCLCGEVTFKAQDVESHVHACHCSMCRKWNGGAATATYVGSVEFNGEENITRYASSDWAERGFCKLCGSNLYYLLKPDQYIIGTGLFDKQDFELGMEIFYAGKPDWYEYTGEHPKHSELPNGS